MMISNRVDVEQLSVLNTTKPGKAGWQQTATPVVTGGPDSAGWPYVPRRNARA